MIVCSAVTRSAIRGHYDAATPFYRLLWGSHIHHGLWDEDPSPSRAQRRLVEHLADAASIGFGSAVLDVGCGMGGSAIYLAQTRGCRVTGVTLSPLQRLWAGVSASLNRVGRNVRCIRRDVEAATFPPASFDVVWSVECTEHLFDKARFFRNAAAWLRPGGRAAVCAWLAGDEPHSPEARQRIHDVCEGFLCPSLGTAADYANWLEAAGFELTSCTDLTEQVARTWEICERRVRRSGVRRLARCLGRNMTRFVDGFQSILAAYQTGAMRYASFVAQVPNEMTRRRPGGVAVIPSPAP